jgi:dienelactone hydrolase
VTLVLVNGGTSRAEPGTWSATSELLAEEVAALRDDVRVAEVRYRLKSWHELPSCIADAHDALDEVARGADGTVLLAGFSMGGAVAVAVAGHPAIGAILGLAPWLPERLSLAPLAGRRFDVVHGAWDRALPGVPGVSAASSRAGFERALRAGAHGIYALIPRGLHGCAVRRPSGALLRLPRWRAWVQLTVEAVDRFAGPRPPRA